MRKEENRKPKCKGVWKFVKYAGAYCYQCTKCGGRISPRQGLNPINHKDEKR